MFDYYLKNENIFIKLMYILSYLFVFCMNKSFFLNILFSYVNE